MNKRTHKMGRAPVPYSQSFDEFEQTVENVIHAYHNTPQRGGLDGLTPNQAMQLRQATRHEEEDAYLPCAVTRESCALAFGERRRAAVTPSGLKVDGAWYYSDELHDAFCGRHCEISYAPWAPESVFVLKSADDFLVVKRAKVFAYDDPAGAKEQQRRASEASKGLRLIGMNAPKIDAVAETRRHADALPPMVQPETVGTISLGHETDRALAAAIAEADAQPASDLVPLQPLERIEPRTGELRRRVPNRLAEAEAARAQRQKEENARIAAANWRALGINPERRADAPSEQQGKP